MVKSNHMTSSSCPKSQDNIQFYPWPPQKPFRLFENVCMNNGMQKDVNVSNA